MLNAGQFYCKTVCLCVSGRDQTLTCTSVCVRPSSVSFKPFSIITGSFPISSLALSLYRPACPPLTPICIYLVNLIRRWENPGESLTHTHTHKHRHTHCYTGNVFEELVNQLKKNNIITFLNFPGPVSE